MKNLVIVESPTKAKTISKYLDSAYNVESSKGHIRDLPKSKLGVAIDNNFEPKYTVVRGKGEVIKQLKKMASKADSIWLATDLDREGEAIAYHLNEAVVPDKKNVQRVVFHEITEDAIENAFKNPRGLDLDLVAAQKARRILDRLVGYKLSPLLWKKIQSGLSAGRVQSVAVRFIVEREKERESFSEEKYWTIDAQFKSADGDKLWTGLKKINGEALKSKETISLFSGDYTFQRTDITTAKEAEELAKEIENGTFKVSSVAKKDVRKKPYPPFTTSSLQSAAAGMGFSSSRTMRTAQKLYEEGLITYHRTDSRTLSKSVISQCRSFVKNNLGDDYLPSSPVVYQTKSKTAQEAHEAIRPTQMKVRPGKVRSIGEDEEKLYELIWRQTIACQMKPAVFSRTTIDVSDGKFLFRGVGSILKFEGWLKVRPKVRDRYKENEVPILKEAESLAVAKVREDEHETTPPPRYSEASLIKELKKNGIGRPSTYAPIVSTIQRRGYVTKDGNYFVPSDVGVVVTDFLAEHFPNIVDIGFTANMEDDLDRIAAGEEDWVDVVEDFWKPFSGRLQKKEKEVERKDVTVLEETEEKCPECDRNLVIKLGKYGKFYSCSGFPECKYARPYSDVDEDGEPDKVDEEQLKGECPKCGSELELREGRYGKFVACSNYPDCKFTKNYLDKIGMKCPECKEGEVIVKRTRKGRTFYGCSRYPKCDFASWSNPKNKKTKKDNGE